MVDTVSGALVREEKWTCKSSSDTLGYHSESRREARVARIVCWERVDEKPDLRVGEHAIWKGTVSGFGGLQPNVKARSV